jgi:hypothetical protein
MLLLYFYYYLIAVLSTVYEKWSGNKQRSIHHWAGYTHATKKKKKEKSYTFDIVQPIPNITRPTEMK